MVGVDDFLALVAAFGSSEGDDNYNVQADVNDDGTVGVDDFLAFIGSFGKTAAVSGKPLVLLPGINENAEFSLSLGSDARGCWRVDGCRCFACQCRCSDGLWVHAQLRGR